MAWFFPRCRDVITFCEVHREFYLTEDMNPIGAYPECCEDLFNKVMTNTAKSQNPFHLLI